MKKVYIILAFIFFALLLSGFARAETQTASDGSAVEPPDVYEQQASQMGTDKLVDALPDEAQDVLGGLSITDAKLGDAGLSALWSEIREQFFGIFKRALKSAAKILTIIILCAAAGSAMSDGSAKDVTTLSGTIAVAAIAVGDAGAFLGMGLETLNKLSDFSKALLPVMCSAAAGAGAITSATAKYAATALFMDVLLTVAANVIMPLISIYLAAVIANAALARDTLANISKLLKWVCTTAMTLLVLAFTTYLSLTGAISGKADEFATKLTKTALGTALPVVGSMLSDTAETLVAGAGMVRNAIGIFGLLAFAAVCLTPFITLGAHYLVYKGTGALSEALADKRMSEMISGIGTAFGLMLALVGAGGIMLFFSLLASMKAVSAL